MNQDLKLQQLREQYKKGALLETSAYADPIAQFNTWFKEALESNLPEPNAMCLSTCGKDMQPHSRIVLLKGIEEGFIFYTNYRSAKAKNLAENPKASLNFLWLELERQVRVEGEVVKLNHHKSETYFNSRPLDSQLGAVVSNQSEVIKDRSVLENELKRLALIYNAGNLPKMPENWGGYVLKPNLIEFWQGRPSRLHDRLRYKMLPDNNWGLERLAP